MHQVLRPRRFEEKRRGPGGQGVEDVLVELEGGEDDDPGDLGDLARRLDAVDAGHADVHQHHVGSFAADEVDGLLAVGGFARDLHVGLGLDDHAKPRAHERLVVGDRHADCFHAPLPDPLP